MPEEVKPINAAEVYIKYFQTFARLPENDCLKGVDDVSESPGAWAASYEALFLFKTAVLQNCGPDPVVLDAGAGASSAVLRLWFKNVITCDNSQSYMFQVRRACDELAKAYNFPRMVSGDWVHGVPGMNVDATFYDYGNFPTRIESIGLVIRNTKRVIYFDDVDHRTNAINLRGAVYWESRENGFVLKDMVEARDEYGRWGILGVRHEGLRHSQWESVEAITSRT